jgi:exonuclease III
MTTKPPLQKIPQRILHIENETIPNHRRRKGKNIESNTDSAVHNQTLKQQKQLNDMNTTYLSIITLNVNGFNSPIKRHCLVHWIKKEEPTTCCLQETHLTDRNMHWLKVKGWKKTYQALSPRKQAGVAILITDKVDFKLTLIKQDKEGHIILIKGEIHQKEITIIKLYAPDFIKHTLKDLKTYIDSNIVVVGDFNTPLSPIDRSSKQKNQ